MFQFSLSTIFSPFASSIEVTDSATLLSCLERKPILTIVNSETLSD
jgi:hypothetical protein